MRLAIAQQACEGHLPTVEEAAQFDGIIVAGSHYSAYEEREWINKLLDLLPKVAALGVRMYGCCFGCQVRQHVQRIPFVQSTLQRHRTPECSHTDNVRCSHAHTMRDTPVQFL